MTIAMGTSPTTCRHGATGPDCGICAGERVRATAAASGRPEIYVGRVELGWSWASLRDGVPHFVPAEGDRGECGRLVPRGARTPTTTGIAATACGTCWRGVLGDTPRRSRS